MIASKSSRNQSITGFALAGLHSLRSSVVAVCGRSRLKAGIFLLPFLLCAAFAMAQLDTGTISGSVTDQSGAAVPGVEVSIKNVDTGISRSLVTNEVGRYDGAALPAGTYEVTAS